MRKKINIFVAAVLFSFILWGSISLSDDYYSTINVPLQVIDYPEGYISGTVLPEKISLKVRGQGWKLVSTEIGTESDYVVSVNFDSGKKYINLYNNLTLNRWLVSELEVIDIIPDTISLFVEKVVSKKIGVIPDLRLNFKPGYGLASEIKHEPDSINISGPFSLVSSISEIKTTSTSLKDLSEQTEKIIFMPKLPGITFNIDFIKVSIDVQKIVDKEFTDVPVEVMDVPPDKNLLLLPNKIDCNVRGGINILGKLDKEEIKAYVFYDDIVRDTVGSIVPYLELPANTALHFIKPERLRYIIKTY